jgi:transposase
MVGTYILLALQNIVLYSDLMRRPLKVKSHLEIEELELRYRKAKDPVEKSQWQIVWLLSKGKTTREISEITGYGLTWIRAVVHRYNGGGPMALGDRRHHNGGAEPLLSKEVQHQLRKVLRYPPPDGGRWTCRRVADWIEDQSGHKVSTQLGWNYLKRLGLASRRQRL